MIGLPPSEAGAVQLRSAEPLPGLLATTLVGASGTVAPGVTGIEGADYKVTFEIDEVGPDAREGWFVVIQGAAHHSDSADDRASAWAPDVQRSARATRDHFVRITPAFVAGRRLRRP